MEGVFRRKAHLFAGTIAMVGKSTKMKAVQKIQVLFLIGELGFLRLDLN